MPREFPFRISSQLDALAILQVSDIGASMLVHAFGAYFGLTVSCVLRRDVSSDKEGAVYHSDVFAMIGKFSSPFSYRRYFG